MGYWYPLATPTVGEDEVNAVVDVLRSGNTTMGERVEEFEEAFARYADAPHAVMVNSGSSADLLAAYATDTTGEVIVPIVTWPTHVWSWEQSGAVVKFCDVDGINTTAELIESKATPKTRVISLVHLMGVPCDMHDILRLCADHDWALHEDCCEALGARYGRHPVGWAADVATWSFFFSHQMTTLEGGMITTSHADVAKRLRSLRSHGWTRHYSPEKYTFDMEGFNLRPTEVAAAIGLVQLGNLDAMNAARSENFHEFERKLRGHPNVKLPEVPVHARPSWFGVPLFVGTGRDDLAKYLEAEGVETRPILAGNLRNQRAFQGFYFPKTPGADVVEEQGLYVGLPLLPASSARQVATMIGDFF
jgi:CDP-4-dehydro-6-deoxyglucose reductase, E1